jgi:hypothetical protein
LITDCVTPETIPLQGRTTAFQLYLEHLMLLLECILSIISGDQANAPNWSQPIGESCNVQISVKKINWNVFGVVCLGIQKSLQKRKEKVLIFSIAEVTGPDQGLLIDTTSRHF